MKKRFFYYAFAALSLMGSMTFTACSDDDDEAPFVTCPVQPTEFTVKNGLQLTYSNAPMVGYKVNFAPSGDKAILKITSDLDLSALMGGMMGGKADLGALIKGPGLLPGTPDLTLQVDLKINGDQCTFEGAGETDFCTYAYKGTVSSGSLNLAFQDVKLKNTSFVGKWGLAEFRTDDWGQVTLSSPIHLKWKAAKGIPFFGMEQPIDQLLNMILAMPMIPAQPAPVAPVQMLSNLLKDITFQEDGNIVATYKKAKELNADWQTSPVNLAQYVVVGEGRLKVFLNPMAILAVAQQNKEQQGKAAGNPMAGLIGPAMKHLLPMLSGGVPVAYTQQGDSRQIFLDKETLLPIMQDMLVPLFSNPEFVQMLLDKMAQKPGMENLSGMIKPMLEALPEVIKTTEELEIGLNLKQVK